MKGILAPASPSKKITIGEGNAEKGFINGRTYIFTDGTTECTWTPNTPATCYYFVLDDTNFTSTKEIKASSPLATHQKSTNDDSYLMVIPQTISNCYFSIEYDVKTEEDGDGTPEATVSNKIDKSLNLTLDKGKKCKFSLDLSPKGSDVQMNVTMSNWTDASGTADSETEIPGAAS